MRNAESLKEELGRARHSERLAKERLVQLTSNPNLVNDSQILLDFFHHIKSAASFLIEYLIH